MVCKHLDGVKMPEPQFAFRDDSVSYETANKGTFKWQIYSYVCWNIKKYTLS